MSMDFRYFVIMSPLKVVLEIEEDENVKSLQTDRQTDG